MRFCVVGLVWLFMMGGANAMDEARGSFQVTLEPLSEQASNGVTLGRMGLTKTFSGELEGRAEGEMLTALTPVESSAVYVAIERFEGSLNGLHGSFALSHRGVMEAGDQNLSIEIVPDSGTGELSGIRGAMTVDISNGAHFYTLTYSFSDQSPADE